MVLISLIVTTAEGRTYAYKFARASPYDPIQAILAGTFTGVQGDIRCKVLVALSTVK